MTNQSLKKKLKTTSKISIIASRFNEFITKRLLEACVKELTSRGVKSNNIKTLWVPGSFELPLAALSEAKNKSVHGVICLGAVIRGETYHFELIAQCAAQGILQVSLQTGKPVIFGVLTTDTLDQAYKRSESKGDNKGRDAAAAVLEMADIL